MACSPSDLKDFILGELAGAERVRLQEHVAGCAACRAEIDRLRLTHAALASLRGEEIPRRIAFVSDKVFEPGWWGKLWRSGPQLGFVAAAMLTLAILAHAWIRPASPPVVAGGSETDVVRRVEASVEKALRESDARHTARTAELLDATRKQFDFERRADMVAVEENFTLLRKQLNGMFLRASVDLGGAR